MSKTHYTIGQEWLETRARESLATTVFEPDETPVFTGLYDAAGNKLFRETEREKIGFNLTPTQGESA